MVTGRKAGNLLQPKGLARDRCFGRLVKPLTFYCFSKEENNPGSIAAPACAGDGAGRLLIFINPAKAICTNTNNFTCPGVTATSTYIIKENLVGAVRGFSRNR